MPPRAFSAAFVIQLRSGCSLSHCLPVDTQHELPAGVSMLVIMQGLTAALLAAAAAECCELQGARGMGGGPPFQPSCFDPL